MPAFDIISWCSDIDTFDYYTHDAGILCPELLFAIYIQSSEAYSLHSATTFRLPFHLTPIIIAARAERRGGGYYRYITIISRQRHAIILIYFHYAWYYGDDTAT